MSDSYQAIYDAVRSRISGSNISEAVAEAARCAFDISHIKPLLLQELFIVSQEMQRPSVLFRPTLRRDGISWCALYGEDVQTGTAAFGDTPEAAMRAFDEAWRKP